MTKAHSLVLATEFLSLAECDNIRYRFSNTEFADGSVGGDKERQIVHAGTRRCGVASLSDTNIKARIFLHLRCLDAARFGFGGLFFDPDDPVNLMSYGRGGHYVWHSDVGTPGSTAHSRSLSFSIQLSPETDYEGGNLEFRGLPNADHRPRFRRCGTLVAFPSNVAHRVTTITAGRRVAIVGWLHNCA